MVKGLVYVAVPDTRRFVGHRVERCLVALERLESPADGLIRLRGEHVEVRNAGEIHVPGDNCRPVAKKLGDVTAALGGELVFEPGSGGGRLDRVDVREEASRTSYIAASRFGEVNTYFHLDRIAAYVASLLRELGAPPLPRVVARVTAHGAATVDQATGLRDGMRSTSRWRPFQGGHYRLPSHEHDISEREELSPDGEIHLGPGWRLTDHGELVATAGKRYRFNASHNAGIIYHEFGHHLARHTADFRGNAKRDPVDQDNKKTAMEEGSCDYWTATMLATPHIWAWHRRHDEYEIHRRSLASGKSMEQFDADWRADPHDNGTIWGAALWDLRESLSRERTEGVRIADLLVLKGMLLIGTDITGANVSDVRTRREPFEVGVAAILRADKELFGGEHHGAIVVAMSRRGILTPQWNDVILRCPRVTPSTATPDESPEAYQAHGRWSRHVPSEEVPADADIMSAADLQRELDFDGAPAPTVLAVGDVMLGARSRFPIAQFGDDYPFAAVRPLLCRAPIVLANLEGPLTRVAKRERRQYSYRVHTKFAEVMRRAGINVLTLANNHLTDCGRAGVIESIESLVAAGIAPIGAGPDRRGAHAPAILTTRGLRIGFLGYYWNTRTSATETLPGSAMDAPEAMKEDIQALRAQVDRVVVTFHWGIPYMREVAPEDRAKARLAIDLGADAVIGHHPHVIQAFEVHRSCPIFYSVGNFTFGSGNSRAECLMVALAFESHATLVRVYPVYVKNRDPRVNYQPKMLRGAAADHVLKRLASLAGESGALLRIECGRGFLKLAREGQA